MPVAAVSERDFTEEVLASDVPVLVVFSADRCIPCQHMTPALGVLGREMAGKIKLFKIDADREADIKAEYGVHALPTLVLFKSGRAVARRVGAIIKKEALQEWINVELIQAIASSRAAQLPRATGFRLANGMEVAVIRDHRRPVVTHMLWYRVGAADEPEGVSGVSQLLQHLMFRSRDELTEGEFAKTVRDLGGVADAVSYRDTTVYYERIASDQLGAIMELEAARMADLHLAPHEAARERQVIVEHRRSIALDPVRRFSEKMDAALYQEHPYAVSTIGPVDALNRLSRKDAIAFYKKHYAPNNAVLVVCGDVTEEDVRALAENSYGKIPANPDIRPHQRPQGPAIFSPRRVTHKDPSTKRVIFQRRYLVPSYATGRIGEPEALDVLTRILCNSPTSRLLDRLVDDGGLASNVNGKYRGHVVDSGVLAINVTARDRKLAAIEAIVDETVEDLRRNGPTEIELARAKKAILADYILNSGSQGNLATRYGYCLATGRSIAQIEAWPENIAKTSIEDIVRVACDYLDTGRSVTGWLQPG